MVQNQGDDLATEGRLRSIFQALFEDFGIVPIMRCYTHKED
jgi:hypothetical protein